MEAVGAPEENEVTCVSGAIIRFNWQLEKKGVPGLLTWLALESFV